MCARWSASAALPCCGRRICSTRSQPTTRSSCCIAGRSLAAGDVPDVVASAGAADMRSAFIALTGAAPESAGMSATDQRPARGFTAWPVSHLPARHRLARGAALPASARALRLGAGAAAGVAVHLRRRIPPDPRRLDHPAVRHLCPVRGLRHARTDGDDPVVQRHAVLAVDGLRPRDGQHAHAAGQPVPALVPADRQAAGQHGGVDRRRSTPIWSSPGSGASSRRSGAISPCSPRWR